MTPVEILPKLYLLKFPSQTLVTSTFMRVQEFYESPYDKIRGNHFTWEEFLDSYTHNGKMTYCADYLGFNVPGDVFIKFFYLFQKEMTNKEKELWEILKPVIRKHQYDFYVIAVFKEKDIVHEVAHGLFYLNKDYRKEVTALIQSFSKKYFNRLCQGLAKRGYPPQVFVDEIQAYAVDKKQKKFVHLFKKYRSQKLDNQGA